MSESIEDIKEQILASINPDNQGELVFTDRLVSILNEAVDNKEKQDLITQAIIEFNEANPGITSISVVGKGLRYFPDVSCMKHLMMVDCRNNQLTELSLKQKALVECSNNKLILLYLPEADWVNCDENKLTLLNLPNAVHVSCNKNNLELLNAPNAFEVYCDLNWLRSLYLPNAFHVSCNKNNLELLNLPLAKEVYCSSNPDLFLENVNAPNWEGRNLLPSNFAAGKSAINPEASSSSAIQENAPQIREEIEPGHSNPQLLIRDIAEENESEQATPANNPKITFASCLSAVRGFFAKCFGR